MKLGIISDPHLNWLWDKIKASDDKAWNERMFWMLPDADILVIAGDICDDDEKAFKWAGRSWMAVVSERYKYVVFVTGNHSYWGASFGNLERKIEEHIKKQKLDNVIFLNNSCFHVPETDIVFVGGTLWTDFNKHDPLCLHNADYYMNDYRYIKDENYRKITPERIAFEHHKTRKYIEHVAQENKDKRIVVVTHHLPSYALCAEEYRGQESNHYYASSMEDVILDNENIKLWCSGHVHHRIQKEIGQCLCCINAVGYAGQETQRYQPMAIEI